MSFLIRLYRISGYFYPVESDKTGLKSINQQCTDEQGEVQMADRYKIVRFFERKRSPRTILTGLSLQQAQDYCSDPETASRTAQGARKLLYTIKNGPWFDGYKKEA